MDVSKKIDQKSKQQLINLSIEARVLQKLTQEKMTAYQELSNYVMRSLTPNPQMYVLNFSNTADVWELKLKTELIVPGQPAPKLVKTN